MAEREPSAGSSRPTIRRRSTRGASSSAASSTAPDDRIEVGVAIVGGGTAGLACANRLLALLADDPATAERLGEVPVAVIEKAKACGGHSLSGAVMRPRPLLEALFPDVTREQWRRRASRSARSRRRPSTCCPAAGAKLRIPTPPPFRNHGAEVVSVAALARFQQRRRRRPAPTC